MTQKTAEEIFQACINDLLPMQLREDEIEELRAWFIVGYQAAPTPNWRKLPELPKKCGEYWVTDIDGEVYTLNFSGERFYSESCAWKVEELKAWAEIQKPEPFKEEVCLTN